MSGFEHLAKVTCPSGALVVLDSGLASYWSNSEEPTRDPFAGVVRDLEIVGPDARRAGEQFGRQLHPLFLFDIPDVNGMTRLFRKFCAERQLQASCRPLKRRVPHRERVRLSLSGRPLALVQYVGMWAAAVTVPCERPLVIRGERMPPGEFEERWRRLIVDVEEGVAFSEERLEGVMVDHARLLLGDADSLDRHSLELETTWGDGIFPVVMEKGSQGQVLRLRVELGDEQRQQNIRQLLARSIHPQELVKYDDASWHLGDDFPAGQPPEFAGTHIALFLRWCFCKGWSGPVFAEPDWVEQVASGQVSATEFFFRNCDGKLLSDMLSEAGNAFAGKYYGDQGLYLEDYTQAFGELKYSAPDTAHDFARYSEMIEARVRSGELTKPRPEPGKIELAGWGSTRRVVKPSKPWWKLW